MARLRLLSGKGYSLALGNLWSMVTGGRKTKAADSARSVLVAEVPADVEHGCDSTQNRLAVMNACFEVTADRPRLHGFQEILRRSCLPVVIRKAVFITPLAIVFAPLAILAKRGQKAKERSFVGHLLDQVLPFVRHTFSPLGIVAAALALYCQMPVIGWAVVLPPIGGSPSMSRIVRRRL